MSRRPRAKLLEGFDCYMEDALGAVLRVACANAVVVVVDDGVGI